MIDVKKAVNVAKEYLSHLLEADYDIQTILLEEVEQDYYKNQRNTWIITLSIVTKAKFNPTIFPEKFMQEIEWNKKEYKTVILDTDGNVLAMKIREFENK